MRRVFPSRAGTIPVGPVYGGGVEDLFRLRTYIHYGVVVLVCTGGEEGQEQWGGGGGHLLYLLFTQKGHIKIYKETPLPFPEHREP